MQHLISKVEGGRPSAEAIAAKNHNLLHVHRRHARGRFACSTRLCQGRLAPSKGACIILFKNIVILIIIAR